MTSRRPRPSPSRVFAVVAIVAGLVVVVAVIAFFASDALARPGGGSSFRGGSRSSGTSRSSSGGGGHWSSSGSSGGGSDSSFFLFQIVAFLFRLCIDAPAIGIPLVLVILGVLVIVAIAKNREGGLHDWHVGAPNQGTMRNSGPSPEARSVRADLEVLRASDENFSAVLLEDFLAALYVEVHTARGRQALGHLSAYVSSSAITKLTSPGLVGLRDIIVGAMRFTSFEGPSGTSQGPNELVRVEIEFETNFTELSPGPGFSSSPSPNAAEQSYYTRERWRIARKLGVRSRPPERARIFPCPSCGGPLDQVIAGVCRHCGQTVSEGDFDWVVEDVTLLARESRGPMLTGTTEEQGTNLETVIDPEAQPRLRALSDKDPAFDFNALQGRVALIFANFQLGWANRDLTPMRPFFTDNLFGVQAYWVTAYKKQNLRNITERARVTNMHLARVTSDKWFDAITIRVFATGLDYTLTDDGRVVAGHKSRERAYTEYWTLIRASGRKGTAQTEAVCPNCGAPLAISMAGTCQYCRATVCSGEFDWVLSRIEQDETYNG
jgi:hypothetical protein